MAECFLVLPLEDFFLNLPNVSAVDSLFDMQTISKKQHEDVQLVACISKYKDLNFERTLDRHKVICYSKSREQRQSAW